METTNGIGTLSEKSTHSFIKDYIEPDKNNQEIKVGNYIADIKRDNEIFEIQTQQFKKLISKLNYYIELGYKTTVVYPLAVNKYINWVDPVSHEIVEKRKSSHKGVIQDIFKELYWIIDYIVKEQITLKIIMLNTEEYKYLDGYGQSSKKRATKIDKVPASVINEIDFSSVADLKNFVPYTPDETWTTSDFIKKTKCNKRWVGSGIKLLRENNIISLVRKQGNAYVYRVNK